MGLARLAAMLFALAALIVPAVAADVTFTGNVAYRERITLPPGSSLSISLVRLPGGQRVTGAQAAIEGTAGSPLQFTLNVRSNVLSPAGEYGLVAEIRHQGRALFSNSVAVPVDPLAPSDILIPVQLSTLTAQERPEQAFSAAPPNPLLDIVWIVTSIGGDPVLPATQLTFSIAADYRVGGQGGCNNYFTEASFESPPLAFGPIAGTRMACDPLVMAQESRFFSALAATAGYDLSGPALKLVDAAGVPLLGLVRQP